jgi:hypothetical protein
MDLIKTQEKHPHVSSWTTCYSAVAVIVNRETKRHRDPGGGPTCFDALVSAGTHSGALFDVPDLALTLKYDAGTVVLIAGRLLSHRVRKWTRGERICMAYFMRDNVHERYNVERPGYQNINDYQSMLSTGYASRQRRENQVRH